MQGNALASQAQYRDAIRCYEKILELAPRNLDAINNRGNCLSLLGEFAEAIKTYDAIIAARPNDLRAHCNRANALKHLGRCHEALAEYERVLEADPGNADALYNRGNMFADLGLPKEAIRDLRRALALNPKDPDTSTSLIFALNFDPDATAQELQAERTKWGSRYDDLLNGVAHPNKPEPDRRLRIGYVSAHFRHQAATYAFGGVIVHHDPQQFEIVAYSDTRDEDALTERLRSHVHSWRRTAHLSDDQLSSLIRADRIDILVDLVGHMKGNRLLVFAQKPAPIQVTAWGEPTGTGLKAIDYIFADPILIPAAERSLLRERVARSTELPRLLVARAVAGNSTASGPPAGPCDVRLVQPSCQGPAPGAALLGRDPACTAQFAPHLERPIDRPRQRAGADPGGARERGDRGTEGDDPRSGRPRVSLCLLSRP
jgi:protein O-GlcNAc transferase